MYSTASDGNVTLQLKEPDDLDKNSLAAMLARLQDDSSFSIYTQDTDILSDSGIDVLLSTGPNNSASSNSGGAGSVTATFDLFDSSSGGPDLTLSPQTFINDNSNSLGTGNDAEAKKNNSACLDALESGSDTVSTTTKDDAKPEITSTEMEPTKSSRSRTKPKSTSPNRQGPQQCQICAKVFGNASALAKHKLTHSDERKYVCTVCGKAFKRQDHLNGHLLTHRNKKPYECKVEACGKSYCDARSLRRHTENHHNPSSASSASSNSSSTTMSPAQGAASGDAASPHGSSCIQYAPPPSTSPSTSKDSTNSTTSVSSGNKSQLKQLLSTAPANKRKDGKNDGLTKQQLDLIHQIMEQTQKQTAIAVAKASTIKNTFAPISKSVRSAASSTGRSKDKKAIVVSTSQIVSSSSPTGTSWSSSQQSVQPHTTLKPVSVGASSPQPKVTTTTPCITSPSASPADNRPMLKPVECNLCHRKFKNIPALNGHMRLHGGFFKKDEKLKAGGDKKDATPLQTASVSVRALIEEKIINKRINSATSPISSTNHGSPTSYSSISTVEDLDKKISSFVVPAPPQNISEKARRHSDAETLKGSKTQREAEALAELILKKDKVSVKRTTSDPGQLSQQILQFRSDSFSLDNSEPSSEDSQFVTPSLHDGVFSQENILLQGVDPNQLDQLQFRPEALLDGDNDGQLQELNLEDIASLQEESITSDGSPYPSNHSVNQDLQAVLNSPLPESLADFSTYHTGTSLDMQSPSFSQVQSPAQYSRSPHPSLNAQSPLQSPLITHDSIGFAYPTPPASHEGQSPFGQGLSIPLVSPPQQEFGQVTKRGLDEPPQASSPLSAAFYTTTMSSSAAVEEAIQQVLPDESLTDNIYPLTDTPPLHSESDSFGLTPVPSPVVTTSVPSPHPSTTYSPNPSTSSTTYGLMLPNSDDPLLSSNPKDFASRKRFEINGIPVRLISNNGLIDLNNTNFAGLILDANGEIKLIQANGNTIQTKNFVVTNTQLVTTSTQENQDRAINQKTNSCSTKILTQRPKLVTEVRKDDTNTVFLSPTTIPASTPIRIARKRHRTETLQLPVLHQSKLRATRSKPQGSSQYTPQPILNPQRSGTGLYANMKCDENPTWSNDPIPETDSTPHINVGPQFQCKIPNFCPPPNKRVPDPPPENLLWDPGIIDCSDKEVDMYLNFACCAAVPGGGRNKEYAMHLLHMCGGNIHDAMLRLMQPHPILPADHPLLAYQYAENEKWTALETEMFHRALLKHDKDFEKIADELKTKSITQCIQFYYVWKKVCQDEYGRLKTIRQLKRNHKSTQMEVDEKAYPDIRLLGMADSESPMRGFACEYPDCSASFNSRAALNGHIRIHGGTVRITTPAPAGAAGDKRPGQAHHHPPSVSSTICHPDSTDQEYPCKICGKVFSKIKSRSAHMKSHRPPDAEPSSRRRQSADNKDTHKDPSKDTKEVQSSSNASNVDTDIWRIE